MADKEQIMINSVDVSECLFYQSNFEEDYDVKIKHFCSNWHNSCESINNSNCYFKQLARKTQECEQKEKEINELHLIIDRLLEANGYDKNISTAEDFEDVYADIDYKLGLLDELKHECEELKKRATIAEDNFACEVQARLYHQNEWLKFSKECEELKKQLKTSEKWRINAESLNEKLDIKNTRYRKALEEIEGIIKSSTKDFNHIDWEAKASHALTAVDKISDIISKAKERENE